MLNEYLISVVLKQLVLLSNEQNKRFPNPNKINHHSVTLANLVFTINSFNESGLTAIDGNVVETLLNKINLENTPFTNNENG